MAAFNKFNAFVQNIGRKLENLHTDALKVMLSNTVPVATNAVKTDITEIAAGNGYSAGGGTVPNTSFTQVSGTATLVGDQVVFTATGAVGPFRYAVLYDSVSNDLIGWFDYASSISLANTDTFTVQFNSSATAGTILTIT